MVRVELLQIQEITFQREHGNLPLVIHGKPEKVALKFEKSMEQDSQKESSQLLCLYSPSSEGDILENEIKSDDIVSVTPIVFDELFCFRLKTKQQTFVFGSNLPEVRKLWIDYINSFKECGDYEKIPTPIQKKPEEEGKLKELKIALLSVLFLNKQITVETIFDGDPIIFPILAQFRVSLLEYSRHFCNPSATIVLNFGNQQAFKEPRKTISQPDMSVSVASFMLSVFRNELKDPSDAENEIAKYEFETLKHTRLNRGEVLGCYGFGSLFTVWELNVIPAPNEKTVFETPILESLLLKEKAPSTPLPTATFFLPPLPREDGLMKKTIAIDKTKQQTSLNSVREFVAKRLVIPHEEQFLFTAQDNTNKKFAFNMDWSLEDYGFGWRWNQANIHLNYESLVIAQLESKEKSLFQRNEEIASPFYPSPALKEIAWIPFSSNVTKTELMAAIHYLSRRIRTLNVQEEHFQVEKFLTVSEGISSKIICTNANFDLQTLSKKITLLTEMKKEVETITSKNKERLIEIEKEVEEEKLMNEVKKHEIDQILTKNSENTNVINHKKEQIESLRESLNALQQKRTLRLKEHKSEMARINHEIVTQRAFCKAYNEELERIPEVSETESSAEMIANLKEELENKTAAQTKLNELAEMRLLLAQEKYHNSEKTIFESEERVRVLRENLSQAASALECAACEIRLKKNLFEKLKTHFNFARELYETHLNYLTTENKRALENLTREKKVIEDYESLKLKLKDSQVPLYEKCAGLEKQLEALKEEKMKRARNIEMTVSPRHFIDDYDDPLKENFDIHNLLKVIYEQKDLLLQSGMSSLDLFQNFLDRFTAKSDALLTVAQ